MNCLSLLLQDHIIRLCMRQADSAIQQLRHELEHLTDRTRNLETEKLACQSAVCSPKAKVAQIPQLIGRINVERHKSNLQTVVVRLGVVF